MQSLNGSQGILENKPNLQTYNNKPSKQKPKQTPKTTKKVTNIFIHLQKNKNTQHIRNNIEAKRKGNNKKS